MIWVKTRYFQNSHNSEPWTPTGTNARHCRVYYAYFYFIYQLCGGIVFFVGVAKNSSISVCRWQLAGCQRWHQTAGVRFATAARNLANYPFSCVFPPRCLAEFWRAKHFAATPESRDEQDKLTGTGCLTPAGPRWVTAAHSYRSDVRPTRANILRQEAHSSFTCAKEHTPSRLPFPLDSFDMVPSLCFALPSVASLPLFCAGMIKASLAPSSWPLHLDARLPRKGV